MSLKERLEQYAESMKDWERIRTSISGVSIVKLPSKSGEKRLALEVNPVDEEGNPIKRKGLYITNKEQWLAFKEIFDDTKALELIESIDELKGEIQHSATQQDDKILEL